MGEAAASRGTLPHIHWRNGRSFLHPISPQDRTREPGADVSLRRVNSKLRGGRRKSAQGKFGGFGAADDSLRRMKYVFRTNITND